MTATIIATPRVGLIDTPVQIRLHGFDPHTLLTLTAAVDVPGYSDWGASATFVTDAAGSVDLDTAVPVDGSYSIPDAGGLIWSLAPMPSSGRRPGSTRFLESGLADYIVHLEASSGGNVLADADLVRQPVAPGVQRLQIREGGVIGTLFLPDGEGPFDTIVVLPGSNGGVPEDLPALYASRGYAALGLGYFGVEGAREIPAELVHVPLEYFVSAFDWLDGREDLRTDRLIVDGTSRGGELALLLASRMPRVTAVIAWVPSLYVYRAFSADPASSAMSAWTWKGDPLPFVPAASASQFAVAPQRDGEPVKALVDIARIPSDPEHLDARIPVEDISGPVLLISGRDDALWPSAVFADWALEQLDQAGFAHEYTHLSYPNAGHTVGPALGPTTVLGDWDEGHGHLHSYGGTPEGVALARRDLWPRVLDFIERHHATRRTVN